jgi:hypothetical protein
MMAAQEHLSGRIPGETDETLQGPPAGLSSHPICLLSGLRAIDECPTVGPEWLRDGRLPARCTWHRSDGGRAAVVWPARYRAWARVQGLLDDRSEAAVRRTDPRRAPPVRAALRIVSPPPGSTYLRDPTLRAEFQTLPLRAETAAAVPLSWEVDGRAVGTASSEAALSWPLRPGAHVVAVTDPHGRRAEAAIVVK